MKMHLIDTEDKPITTTFYHPTQTN
jgi:hypothetical protein